MAGFAFAQSPWGQHGMVSSAPLTDAESYVQGDPVAVTAGQLIECTNGGTSVASSNFIGFAFEAARGATAASRAAIATGSFERASPGSFGDIGATGNVERTYVKPDRSTVMVTRNFWDVAGTARQTIDFSADVNDGALFELGRASAGEWGIINNAASVTADVGIHIVRATNPRGEPFNAGSADVLTDGSNVILYFVIGNIQDQDQIGGV